jgi:hypothetical protein
MTLRQTTSRPANSRPESARKPAPETAAVSPEVLEELVHLRRSLTASRKILQRLVEDLAA